MPLPREFTATDAAYIAGMFDGEGCVMLLRKRDGRYQKYLRCTISNCHLGALEWIQATTGTGSIVVHHKGNERHNVGWNWMCSGQVAAAFLTQLLPYLIIKRDKAEEGIEEVRNLWA